MNLRKLIVIPLLLVISGQVEAQLSLVQKPSNPFKFSSQQVWDINLSSPVDAKLILTAQIRKNQNMVFEAKSQELQIKSGFNSLSSLTVQSSLAVFYASTIKSWHDANGTLPPGKYSICYTARCVEQNCGISVDDVQCFDISIELPTPLLLNSPSDQEIIDDKTPLLTWIPPAPVSPEVRYKLTLVEMRSGQTKTDAILRNIPLLEKPEIATNLLQYPMDIPELVEGNTYAWKVEAQFNSETIATSEVWEFTIGKDTIEEKKEIISYIKVRELTPDSKVHVENTLRLDFHEFSSRNGVLRIQIFDVNNRRKGEQEVPIEYGENLLNIAISGMGLKSDEEYWATISGPDGKSYRLAFIFHHSY